MATWTEEGHRRSQAFATKDAATARMAAVDVAQRAGTHILKSSVTVGEYGDQWLAARLHVRTRTAIVDEYRWRLHIRPTLGSIRLSEVTRSHVQALVAKLAETMAPGTVGVIYVELAGIFKAAADDRMIAQSPCRSISLPAVEHRRVIPLTAVQVHEIAAGFAPKNRAMVYLGAATGMRVGELRGLTVDRLVFTPDGSLRVRIDRQLVAVIGSTPTWGPPKTRSSDRTVTVDPETARMMRDHMIAWPPHATGLVFRASLGEPFSEGSAYHSWKQATRAVDGLRQKSGWHELRHFHASVLIAMGLSVVAVAARLGHRDGTETLKTYGHLWATDDDRSASAIGASLWSKP